MTAHGVAIQPATPRSGTFGEVLRRNWIFVVAGTLLGVLLGLAVLPNLLTTKAQYMATVRLQVHPLPQALQPVTNQGSSSTASTKKGVGSGNTGPVSSLDIDPNVVILTLQALGPATDRKLSALQKARKSEWPAIAAAQMSATLVPGTTDADVSYTDDNAALAQKFVQTYAAQFVTYRNANLAARETADLAVLNSQAQQMNQQMVNWAQKADAERLASPKGTDSTSTQTQLNLATKRYASQVALIDHINSVIAVNNPPTSIAGPVTLSTAQPAVTKKVLLVSGLVLGLILGLGLALLREATRRRVATSDEVASSTKLPVLAVVPPAGGEEDRISALEEPIGPVADAYQRVALSLQIAGLGTRFRTVAVVSPEAETGKTTVVANLGYSLASQGQQVIMIGGDLRAPRLDVLLGVSGRPGLGEILSDPALPLDSFLVQISEGLLVLPTGEVSGNPSSLLARRTLTNILHTLGERAIVLVDTPPATWAADALAMANSCDATMIAARSGHTKLSKLAALSELLRAHEVPAIGAVALGIKAPITDLRYQQRIELTESRQARPQALPRQSKQRAAGGVRVVESSAETASQPAGQPQSQSSSSFSTIDL